ncbi:MAG: BlaI/MecI/CopY family transcriptional regulator [Gemmatimonadetes bacterium]|uniref:BlaI/MecI/CopY family transcriptional regulator n=1 Tax=Candidatus Kutchimonas denitrificans TaxID=3056748 RepID=A0AAE4ZAD7_9BACT|nr:BlaI/MecI/CopY family transcriptional regulator [Gemmatimonadota bacterium]NIR75081.1 BlaI/MecI/CopY family transcriptional regulator [Candidatus Kutchimonas denitrificans]NIS00913.1 BlaI/MecI/CopY family transcriptional regulator [Gemmatimonadota bacterium]NIT66530.1 BlaI/MecI/CopY family transcriptional regulator [Gemmatimonadota bacterium]NIU52876.1 BlaI/MecI/CopY family transcriptional regulator [Gemmatimonadota bacterium]
MSETPYAELSRRERQIMDIIYASGRAGVAEVQEALPDPPSYSAVRALLRILEEKGHLTHEQEGQRYVYRPTVPAAEARESAMKRLVRTFFDGSPEKAMAAFLDMSAEELSGDELARLAELIEQARREGR